MKNNEFMSIQVPLSQHDDRRLLEDGLGRAGHAVFAFAALFFVEIFYGAASRGRLRKRKIKHVKPIADSRY